jgi:hypothetical protein
VHANEGIWEIRQIMVGKGTRVVKEVKEVMMGTVRLVGYEFQLFK